MDPIRIAMFGAERPAIHPRLLPDQYAQTAMNCKLWDGSLRPWLTPLSIVTPTKVGTKLSIYRYGQDVANEAQYWFHWTSDVDVARLPIFGDTSERTAWTGEAEPRITDNAIALTGGTNYPMNWYKLGVPAPAAAPTLATDGLGSGVAEDVSYVYTYVNSYGQEGPPSPPSPAVAKKNGDTLTIGGMSTGPGAGYNIVSKRLYRTITGSNTTDYRFDKEIAVALVSTTSTTADDALAEALPSAEWDPPPTTMLGLIVLENGIMAGFDGNNLCLSEAYQGHAWPVRYQKPSAWGIVGLGSFERSIVVVTKGLPYVAMGTDPGSYTMSKVSTGQAGVSKRSIASIPRVGVCYAAKTGLVKVGPSGANLCTEGLINQDDWEALVPSSMIGFNFFGRYMGFYDTGSVQGGFILDPLSPDAGITFTDQFATAGYNDPQRDRLYLQIGADIKKWDAGATNLSNTWKSKVYVPLRPANVGVGQIHADSYPLTAKLYVDGAVKDTRTVTSASPFKWAGGYKGREFALELSGTGRVKAAYLAESITGLRGT